MYLWRDSPWRLFAQFPLGFLSVIGGLYLIILRRISTFPRPPTPDEIERGASYRSLLAWELSFPGRIVAKSGEDAILRWHCRTVPDRSPYSPLNLIRNPDFVLLDHEERESLRIRRYSRIPPRFNLIQNGDATGTIGLRSIFLNKYAINLKDGPTWTFRMPTFTNCFYAVSSSNSHVWVVMGPSKLDWTLLAEPATDDVRLLAALAFIHRRWWCYS